MRITQAVHVPLPPRALGEQSDFPRKRGAVRSELEKGGTEAGPTLQNRTTDSMSQPSPLPLTKSQLGGRTKRSGLGVSSPGLRSWLIWNGITCFTGCDGHCTGSHRCRDYGNMHSAPYETYTIIVVILKDEETEALRGKGLCRGPAQ